MKTRFALVLGAGVGFILGSRAGREKYDALTAKATQLWRSPAVQDQVKSGQEVLDTVVTEHVPALAKKATHVVRDAMGLELPNE